MLQLLDPKTIIGILTLIGGTIIVLKKMGLVTFGKSPSPSKPNNGNVMKIGECPDRECQIKQAVMAEKVDTIEENQEKMWRKFDETIQGINYIKGRIDEAIKAAEK